MVQKATRCIISSRIDRKIILYIRNSCLKVHKDSLWSQETNLNFFSGECLDKKKEVFYIQILMLPCGIYMDTIAIPYNVEKHTRWQGQAL